MDSVRNVAGWPVRAGIVSSAVSAEGVHLQAVAKDRLVLIATSHHPLAGRRTCDLTDLGGPEAPGATCP